MAAENRKKCKSCSGRLMEQRRKQSNGFDRIGTYKIFVLFIISLNTFIVKNEEAVNVLQRCNGFSRMLGESPLSEPVNDDSTNASTVEKKKKNYFQRKDKDYDKVIQELKEKLKSQYQHSESEEDE
ncbi:hypothetical protein AK88_04564 [Plasmodium fragile]|uniref:Uncharacterized protein n=1 Tax=Plasmodium fragile TaxID=5857 RepID=A0A0D9QFI3_PLAFR|nr:uncharacterized protein AK88_04564 [Plasmodium fragile]KJP85805.1 hypothetical protein AK88_04564 [Plasmodium fragile]